MTDFKITDLFFVLHFFVLLINSVAFFYLFIEKRLHYKIARFMILVSVWIGIVVNFGNATVWPLIFSVLLLLSVKKFEFKTKKVDG